MKTVLLCGNSILLAGLAAPPGLGDLDDVVLIDLNDARAADVLAHLEGSRASGE